MRIRFKTTIDDVIAFHRFHFANSPAWRRQVWIQMLLVPAILGVLFLFAYSRLDPFDENVGYLLFAGGSLVVLSISWAVGIRWYMHWAMIRNTRKFLAEGRNRVMFGWREMELVDGRLILNSELLQSTIDLRAIEKIVSDENYTYVYIASVSAYMIPMRMYPEEDYREFVAELREAWEERDAPRPIEDAEPPDERIKERPR